ncbi:GNAT family N-acetyltransferase [Haloglycomyces albus]|uniref:GNAT family N-acetyltransferase n=1 Tax=Haloglycomyces albus TaxID=526067 RepID=UPI00046D7446|nr:GNAT family N-acetyltransferase [Haloglycomyces albus]
MSSTIWYLETRSPEHVRPKERPDAEAVVRQSRIPVPELNRFCYITVGSDWQWTDRLAWSDAEWREFATDGNVETWLLHVSGTPAGYCEMDGRIPGEVEIASFGLFPAFRRRRLGGWFLGECLSEAWRFSARGEGRPRTERVWLHTCSEDDPHAMSNYQARGMRWYRTETTELCRAARERTPLGSRPRFAAPTDYRRLR